MNLSTLEEVARFEAPTEAEEPTVARCEAAGDGLLVVLDGLVDRSDRPHGRAGWILDPESWRVLCELPDNCRVGDDDRGKAGFFDAQGNPTGSAFL